ncbi:MAG: carbon starvation protein A [Candidatus Latescibacterota bacterium]|nr:MAG: carbon starvation protein A [Candidatus Latescibacterota bacterium]
MILLVLTGVVLFILGYRIYGAFLDKQFGINPERKTPAHTNYDGLDYMPAKTPVLMGHHFSSIAGAGPIVGPIIAVAFFGWLPAVLWIVLGAIFIGGVHDYSALVVSVRHKARSIAQVAKRMMSPVAHKLYLAFIWFTMVYVLTVFVDLTADSFTKDGGVASSSLMYIVLAILMGLSVYRMDLSLGKASLVFVPLVFLAIYLGQLAPMGTPPALAHGDPKTTWTFILLLYCFVASITPVWILLQPRDYLSSYLLLACILGGLGGIAIGGHALDTKAFLGFEANLGYLFPALFITIACGACSGFHSIVASGTTAKQLSNERAARPVAYGSMLVEGMLALIAVSAIVVAGGALAGSSPAQVFASGMGTFVGSLGIPTALGTSFGLLAVSTFLLTTLDTGTRLGRYIFEEFFDRWGLKWHILATTATLILPLWLALTEFKDAQGQVIPAWRAIWPVFGSTNQLLGALALLTVGVWLKRTGRRAIFVIVPMVFMFAVTLLALVMLFFKNDFLVIRVISAFLFALAVVLIVEAVRAFGGEPVTDEEELPDTGPTVPVGGKVC